MDRTSTDEAALWPGRRGRLAVCLALAACFLVLVHAVENGAVLPVDRAILLFLRHANDLSRPDGPIWLLDAMRDVTGLGSTSVTLLVMTVGMSAAMLQRQWRTALFLLLAVGAGSALVNVVKFAVARVRPSIVPHLTNTLTFSFPSSHATMSLLTYGAVATIAARGLPHLGVVPAAVTMLLTLMIGASRPYLGVHYPSDVLAGWMFGLTWLLACQMIVPAKARPH